MSTAYETLLSATILHFQRLKEGGVRFVSTQRDVLSEIAKLPRVPRRGPAPIAPITPDVPAPEPARVTSGSRPSSVAPAGDASATKQKLLGELRARALQCVRCAHLASSRKNVVFGVGSADAELMFVGEAPGADEDTQGEPFVGKAGQLLTRIIDTMGLSRSTVYIANILKCRPDTPGLSSGNRKPTPEEMKTCIPFLHEQIDIIGPKVLVGLGGTAIDGLLGKGGGITQLRGKWHTYRGIPLMPTYHPAYLLRNQQPTFKRQVWEDMLEVMARLGIEISEKQRGYFLSAS